MAGSRRTAARVTPGAICLSSSSHLPLKPYSNEIKPVALPPGLARLSTKAAPTGSTTFTNTIGTVRVACSNGPKVELPRARMTSGASAVSSAACLRISVALVVAQRVSISTLRPTAQPNSCSPCRNAARWACSSGSPAPMAMSTLMRCIRSLCCARAANDQRVAVPPNSVMNSRRFIRAPCRQAVGEARAT